MRISVLGCGRWGSFLAWYLCRTGHEVTLYGRAASWRMERLLKCRENDLLQIPEGVQLTTDLTAAVSRAEALVISVGVQSLRSFLRELAGLDLSGRALVLCMKGLEAETGLRITEIVAQELGPIPCAIWVGPGHVQDFLRGGPNCMVIDSADAALREAFRRAACPHAPAEPLDWMETTCPARWRTDEGEIEYDWDDDFGAEPLKR